MHFHIITLFPDMCRSYLEDGVLGRAQKDEKGKGAKVKGKRIIVSYYNPRDYSKDIHKRVDDRPYGGGPGMVMQVDPIISAWNAAVGKKRNKNKIKTLIMSPRGKTFSQKEAKSYVSTFEHIVLISGRYEGIDDRVRQILKAEEISVGDYVLTGGELPALTIIDATARQIPGVLGTSESLEDDRATNGMSFTRPEIYKYRGEEYKVPNVLVGGDHKAINAWRIKSRK